MRSILLHIADDECLEARTQVALDVTRAFEGHLSCLQAVPYEYGVPGDFYGAVVADLLPVLREAAEKLRDRCEQRLSAEDVAWSWNCEDGRAYEHLMRASALNDLVVVGSREPMSKASSLLARELGTHLQTPMLLVPPHVNGLNCAGAAVVAWNGSVEASRALKAAVPLLAKAKSVLLASVVDEANGEFNLPAIEGAEYLSRHGIRCEMAEFKDQDRSVANVLTDVATQREASFLVMGAYGHSRFVETVVGGVTREIFAQPPLPIFTAH